MLISSGVLVSDCHGAVIYMEDSEYHCMKCLGRCNSAGTLGEQYERDNAIPKERARLEREVIRAAKAYGRANQAVEDHMKKCNEADSDPAEGWQQLRDLESTWEEMLLEAIKPLLEFESQHGI